MFEWGNSYDINYNMIYRTVPGIGVPYMGDIYVMVEIRIWIDSESIRMTSEF